MKASHIKALEMKARWLRWAIQDGGNAWASIPKGQGNFRSILALYKIPLENGDSLYMNSAFCDLVDHARRTIPDDLTFEESWMHTPTGFLWLETPFTVPTPNASSEMSEEILAMANFDMKIHAIGWVKLDSGGYHLMCYQAFDQYRKGTEGFGCWSHFTLRDGDSVLERTQKFDRDMEIQNLLSNEGYPPRRDSEILHEIRWVFAALYLMAQRLAHISDRHTSPLARSMALRKKLTLAPLLKVVSLRRMEDERPKGETRNIEWQWQWAVRGHWRKQFYSSTGEYKQVFIEAYIKGPEDRPLKPPSHTLFNAVR